MTVVPLTTYPGDERQPSFAPGGEMVAFSWNGPEQDNFDIYVKTIDSSTEPLRLTMDPASDVNPTWSPDGRWIAFVRDGRDIMLVPATGGQARRLVSTAIPVPFLNDPRLHTTYLEWSRDSRWLVFTDRRTLAHAWQLWAVSIETLQRRPLTAGSFSDYISDSAPVLSPNGKFLLFARNPHTFEVELRLLPMSPDFFRMGESTVLHTGGYGEIRFSRPSWTRDGKGIIFASGYYRGLTWLSNLGVSSSGNPRGDPVRLEGGGEDAANIAISSDRNGTVRRLAYERRIAEENIWSLDLAHPEERQSQPLIGSTRDDYLPRFSPDGTRIAYVSSRTGWTEIYVSRADGSRTVRLTSVGRGLTTNPRWSPDGTQIVYDSRSDGGPNLFVIDAAGGPSRKLVEGDGNQAFWSHDGQRIYFHSVRSGRPEVWRIAARGGRPEQVTTDGGRYAEESPEGDALYYENPKGLWVRPMGGGHDTRIWGPIRFQQSFNVVKDGVYFIADDPETGHTGLYHYEEDSGDTTLLTEFDKELARGITVAPDRTRLLYSQVDRQESDLMLVENLR